ncbi:MAG: insulinase family protein [Pseudomonadota bacterium]
MILRTLASSLLPLAILTATGCGAPSADEPSSLPPAESTSPSIWPHDTSDLPPEPAVVYGRLENGMRYVILENDTPSGTAALRMRIDSGSFNEREDQAGLSHFLEHMAFNGSTNVPEGEMVKILERLGLAFGADTNAFTSFDQIQYQLDLPSVRDELIDTGLFLMREVASNLTLDPEAIEKERGVITAEERLRNSFSLRRFKHLTDFLTPDAAIVEHLPIGTLDVIENAPAELFRELYEAYYRPETTTLVFVGDFDADDMEDRIIETFADWQATGDRGPDANIGTLSADRPLEVAFFQDPDVPTLISIATTHPGTPKPDTAENRRKNLMRTIGNSILSRRFATLSRKQDAAFLSAGAGFSEYFDIGEIATVDVTTTPENWQPALAVAEQELRRAIEFGFTEAELTEQVANIRTGLENAADRAATRQSGTLAAGLASAIHSNDVFTTPASSLERFEGFADDISTEDVHAAFRAQWEGGSGPLIHLSNTETIDNIEQEILTTWTKSTTVAVTPPEEIVSEVFAYTDFGEPGDIVSDTSIEDLDIRTLIFDNNVRLNLKKTDFEDAIIRISLRIGSGQLEFPKDKDGLGFFMAAAFSQAGLEAHSVDELQRILAGRSVSFGLSASGDSFGASTATTPDDFLLQMQVLAATVTAPGYRPEAEAQYKQLIGVFYPTLDAEPGGILQRDVDRILRGGDIRYGIASEMDLLARSFEELRPVVDRALTEGAIEIGIVGDFDEDAIISAVAETFGALRDRRAHALPFDDAKVLSFPNDRTPLTLNHAGPANKALALVYWPTTDGSDQKGTYTRNILRAVLRLKLTETLREDLGATYSPGAGSTSSNLYPGYGYISATSEVDPGNIDQVFEAIDGIVSAMSAGDISEDELQRARQPILENLEEARERNGAWLAIVDEAQTDPERLERWRTAPEVYASITTADLVDAAATWLQPENALKIRIVASASE